MCHVYTCLVCVGACVWVCMVGVVGEFMGPALARLVCGFQDFSEQ